MSNFLIDQFRAFVGEEIEDDEIIYYLEQGSGNLETSLNYYFNRQEKQVKKIRKSEKQRQQQDDSNAFNQLKKGQKKQQEVQKIVEQARQELKKPAESSLQGKMQDGKYIQNQNQTTQKLSPQAMIEQHQKQQQEFLRQQQQQEQEKYDNENMQIQRSQDCMQKIRISQSQDSENSIEDNNLEQQQNQQQQQEQPDNNLQGIQEEEEEQEQSQQTNKEQFLQQQQIQQQQKEQKQQDQNNNINKRDEFLGKPRSLKDYEKQQQTLEAQEQQNEKIQFPMLLGTAKITFNSLRDMKNEMREGDELFLKCERSQTQQNNQNKKGKKKQNQEKKEPSIIRVIHKEKQIGRLENKYENILFQLLINNYIYIEAKLVWAPPLIKVFTVMPIQIKVFLLEDAITRPITQIIDSSKDPLSKENKILTKYGQTKEEFQQLFHTILDMKVREGTLIKLPTKDDNNNKKNNVNNVNNNKENQQLQQQQLNFQQHKQKQEDLNNPFKKQAQQSTLLKFSKKKEDIQKEKEEKQQQQPNQQEQQQQNQQSSQQQSKEISKLFDTEAVLKDELKLSEPPYSKFKTKLHDYQKQALTWMLMREGMLTEMRKIMDSEYRVIHPLWEKIESEKEKDGVEKCIYFNPYSGQVSLKIPMSVTQCHGGILADEMGLGKTVMMLSLIISNKKYGSVLEDNEQENQQIQQQQQIQQSSESLQEEDSSESLQQEQEQQKQQDNNNKMELENETMHEEEEEEEEVKEGENSESENSENESKFQSNKQDSNWEPPTQQRRSQRLQKISQKNKNIQKTPSTGNAFERLNRTPTTYQKKTKSVLLNQDPLQRAQEFSALFDEKKPQKQAKQNQIDFKSSKKLAKTLIILPVTLLAQWEEEIKNHVLKNNLTHYCYYEGNKKPGIDLSMYDVVLTTYGTVSHQWSNPKDKEKLLYKYDWYRIVLDEAHYIKGRTIQTSKAVFGLKGKNRWCLTGTPVQNKIDELFPLIHFIQLEPWSDHIWWNNYINKPAEKGDNVFYEIVQTIMKPVTMRRTKQSRGKDGKLIIDLPPKNTDIVFVNLPQEERNLYDHWQKQSKEQFDGLMSSGLLMARYCQIFEVLMRLRQLCDHPYLVSTRSDFTNVNQVESNLRKFVDKRHEHQQISMPSTSVMEESNEHSHYEVVMDENLQNEERIDIKQVYPKPSEKQFRDTIQNIKNHAYENCEICLCEMEDATITCCLHVMCRLCMVRSQEATSTCPLCRRFLGKGDFMTVPRESRFSVDINTKYVRSAKIEAIMENLQPILEKKEKVIFFTQWLGMMDLIGKDMENQNIKFLRFDGSLNQKQRAKLLKQFKDDQSICVLMISLKAGGVGLNLTHANHCFIIDPWWNPAVEAQAVERVHRIGQKKPVFVKRFIVESTIEQRMLKLHENKKELFDNTMKTDNSVGMGSKQRNIENIKYLMSNY